MRTILIYAVNIILVILIIRRVFVIDNDKAHLVFLFYYPAILGLNLLIGVVLKLANKAFYRSFWQLGIWMGCLFIPLYAIVIMLG